MVICRCSRQENGRKQTPNISDRPNGSIPIGHEVCEEDTFAYVKISHKAKKKK